MTSYDNGMDVNNFTYDGLGRRVARNGGYYNWAYEYDSNGNLIRYQLDVGEVLEFFYDTTGVAGIFYDGASYFFRKDALGNIVAIIDESGKVVIKYTYDAWGKCNIDFDKTGFGLGWLNPFRYRGYFYDADLGLYYLKSRYYDPKTGRFISQDSVEYIDPETINGLNLYAYCGNNPVMYVDPNGNIPFASAFTKIYHKNLVWGVDSRWWGRIKYSPSMLIEQTDEKGFFYAFFGKNVYNNEGSAGVGINVFGWLGLEIVVNDSYNLSISGNITPWLNLGASIGLSGLSLHASINDGQTNHEVSIGIGLAPVVIVVGVVLIFKQMEI